MAAGTRRLSRLRPIDVIVVGGGPAGTATATRLAGAGRHVVLIERSGYERPRMGETLPPVVNRELVELDAMAAFQALRPVPSHESASAWGHGAVVARAHLCDPYGHGWHVDRARFDAMLADHAAAAGATVMRHAHALAVTRVGDGELTVTIERVGGRDVLATEQVVDATGRAATIARPLGAVSHQLDHLVAASVVGELADGVTVGDTFVEATRDGWWYVSPLGGRQRIISIFTDSMIARTARLTTPSGWWEALQRTEHVARLARQMVPTAPPTVASASSRLLAPAAEAGWIAVGDAALAVDPLASSGVATAFACARLATGVLTAAPFSRPSAISAYDTWIAALGDRYVEDRSRYYGLEQRYLDSPFWLARRAHPQGARPFTGSGRPSRVAT